jgi:2-methylcitrate dehydratase PrpD
MIGEEQRMPSPAGFQSATPELARFLGTLRYEDIPPAVLRQTKRTFSDNLAVTLAGLGCAAAEKFTRTLLKMGDVGDTYLVGTGQKASVRATAMHAAALLDVVNGMSGFRSAINPALHTPEATVPVALAVGQMVRCSGKELLTALVAGFETYGRIALAVDPSHYTRGFFSDATIGCLASSVVACKLKGGSADDIESTIGMAAMFAPMALLQLFSGLTLPDTRYSWGKMLATPYASRAAIDAAFFAEEDFGGQKHPLENPRGFCFATSDNPNIAALTDGLGTKFVCQYAYYKMYCTTRWTHGPIDLTLQLCRENGLGAQDVARVRVGTIYLTSKRNAPTSPSSHVWECLTGSVPYVVAHAILYPDEMFSPDLYTDVSRPRRLPEVHEYRQRVEVVEEPEFTKIFPGRIPTVVEIKTTTGRTFSARSDFFRGDDPELPYTERELDEKFTRFAGKTLPARRTARIKEVLDDLENLKDIGALFELLRPENA